MAILSYRRRSDADFLDFKGLTLAGAVFARNPNRVKIIFLHSKIKL